MTHGAMDFELAGVSCGSAGIGVRDRACVFKSMSARPRHRAGGAKHAAFHGGAELDGGVKKNQTARFEGPFACPHGSLLFRRSFSRGLRGRRGWAVLTCSASHAYGLVLPSAPSAPSAADPDFS